MDNKLNIDSNLSSFTPDQGVAIGKNPNQPETDIEMETTIKALRLVNVGDFGCANDVIKNASFSEHQKDWLKTEIRMVLGFLE